MILLALLIPLILIFLFSKAKKSYHSNWNNLIDDFEYSTNDFYNLLNKELKDQGVDKIDIKTTSLSEGGVFSANRLYLRLSWRDYQYDICAAPFGKGFFISWWLLYKETPAQILVNKIPVIGSWLSKKFFPITYYKLDTASMFMTYAHQAVLNVVDHITKEKGVRGLSDLERRPNVRELVKR